MIVMKFGGSSVADAACMREVAARVAQALPEAPLVVLSATAGTTDVLHEAAHRAEAGDLGAALEISRDILKQHRIIALELFPLHLPAALAQVLVELGRELDALIRGVALLRELSPRSLDAIASIGERMASRILAAYLDADWVDARTVVRTDDTFGCARPLTGDLAVLAARHLAPLLGPGHAVVTQGYIGSTASGLTTTLGRGGSDFSAALFGAALGVAEIQIWTDVEGILTCDPHMVPSAMPIAELSFTEAAELAAFGAKVLHPATIQPAVTAGIPVTVRSTRHPQGRFTTITAKVPTGRPITALAQRGPVTMLTVSCGGTLNRDGFLSMASLFQVFSRHQVSVDLVAMTEASVSFTVDGHEPLEALLADLTGFGTVGVARDRTIVAIVGERLKFTPGVTGRCFGALREINVEMISTGANEINLSFVVKREDATPALRALHAALIESPAQEGGHPMEPGLDPWRERPNPRDACGWVSLGFNPYVETA
jgi:aspartate kinase